MRRPLVFSMLAGLAAGLASLVVYSALKKREAELQKVVANTVQIAVAARDLPLGTKMEPGAVRMARWARDSMPPGAVTEPQTVMGDIVKDAFVENEPIVPTKLFNGEKTAGILPLLIPRGMRAMSVAVDEVSDVAGFILPHAKVDVLVSLSEANGEKSISKVVLQNVEVLAVAQEVEGRKDEPQVVKVVTLLVTPEEAERLALASHQGALRLALRNYADDKIVFTSGCDVDSMLRAYGPPMPMVARAQSAGRRVHGAAAASGQAEVEIMRDGTRREFVSFLRGSRIGRPPQQETENSSPVGGAASMAAQAAGAHAQPGASQPADAKAPALSKGAAFESSKGVDVP